LVHIRKFDANGDAHRAAYGYAYEMPTPAVRLSLLGFFLI
jgi:hypothetical protein